MKISNTAALTANRALSVLLDAGTYVDYEAILEVMYRTFLKEGDTVIDIGAHSGRHLSVFCELVNGADIHAFEPLPIKIEELHEKFGGFDNVIIHSEALTAYKGEATFKYAVNVPGESGLKERMYNVENPGVVDITVKTNMLDNYLDVFKKVDYIKMDIEGGEIDCLRGGMNFIKKFRPIISVEYGYPSYSKYDNSVVTLYELAEQMEYFVFDLFGNKVEDIEEWKNICDSIYWDYFLVPYTKKSIFTRSTK
jgi:FkbM family methyltransferase